MPVLIIVSTTGSILKHTQSLSVARCQDAFMPAQPNGISDVTFTLNTVLMMIGRFSVAVTRVVLDNSHDLIACCDM